VNFGAGQAQIGDLQADISFPVDGIIAARSNGLPACTFNTDIEAPTSISFLPTSCFGAQCKGVRAVISGSGTHTAIPDGVLLTCSYFPNPGSSTFVLVYRFSNVVVRDINGAKVADVGVQVGVQDGLVCFVEHPPPTPY